MIIHNNEQGSPAWLSSRSGVITASMFSTAREKLKSGLPSAAAKSYAVRVAIERLGGQPLDDGMDTWAMKRGRELEPAARARHASAIGTAVLTAGFATTDCGKYGASPDGLINDDGMAEYKCLVAPDRIARVVLEDDISEFEDQVQGQMWVWNRKWVDFCVYLPQLSKVGMDLYKRRVLRDDAFIAKMQADLAEFDKIVQTNVFKLRGNLPAKREEF